MANAEPAAMDPNSSEATQPQLDRAKKQGEAYGDALTYMTSEVAKDGGEKAAGQYLVGYAIEDAEGMYHLQGTSLVWHNPVDEDVHVEVSVRDAADGRFIPGLSVSAMLVTPSGKELGPYVQEFVWHPMLYHYARNWSVDQDGEYILRIHIDPPTFMRHDEVNGKRYAEPVDVEFQGVQIERGAEPADPPQGTPAA